MPFLAVTLQKDFLYCRRKHSLHQHNSLLRFLLVAMATKFKTLPQARILPTPQMENMQSVTT
jgi:hypothetical protein